MRRAALYVHGRIVIADSHLDAFQTLTIEERREYIVSGFIDDETGEFDSDLARDHFYNKEIYLVRHGHVEAQDDPDPEITEIGVEQAECVAEELVGTDLSGFTCRTSPLLRCLQTAQVFSRICGLKFEVDLSLMETPNFLLPHQTFRMKNRYGDFPEFHWPTKHDWLVPYESPEGFGIRIRNVLQDLPNHSILISHFGVITNMAGMALCDEKAIECGVPTASLTHIDNQEVKCLGWTCKNLKEEKQHEKKSDS